jgi:hypothetical protein
MLFELRISDWCEATCQRAGLREVQTAWFWLQVLFSSPISIQSQSAIRNPEFLVQAEISRCEKRLNPNLRSQAQIRNPEFLLCQTPSSQ